MPHGVVDVLDGRAQEVRDTKGVVIDAAFGPPSRPLPTRPCLDFEALVDEIDRCSTCTPRFTIGDSTLLSNGAVTSGIS